MTLEYNDEFMELEIIQQPETDEMHPIGLTLGPKELQELVQFMHEKDIIPNALEQNSKYEGIIMHLESELKRVGVDHALQMKETINRLKMEHLVDLRMQVGISYHLMKEIPKREEKSLVTPSGNAL